ncbi:esterase, putative [Lachnospiraceae bacterium KM106-2]|nr:esterase, putative [Lachnospiraceae bacterium KM106-2]
MPSIRYHAIKGMFRVIGIKKKLKVKGTELRTMMNSYIPKQDHIKIPFDKMDRNYDFSKRVIGGCNCYITKQKGKIPKKALLYVFGGGYFLPCDPGDFIFGGQFADQTMREIWFPIYPLAPRYRLLDSVKCVLAVYQEMLKKYAPEDISMFGTSSGGGLVLSLLMYIKKEQLDIPMPDHLILQSPGLQVPPSEKQYRLMMKIDKKEVMIPPDFFYEIAGTLTDRNTAYLLSPLLFDITGFPRMDIIYGSYEIMYAYLPDMIKHCKECGVLLTPHIGEKMMHCWLAMDMTPEGKLARKNVFQIVNN